MTPIATVISPLGMTVTTVPRVATVTMAIVRGATGIAMSVTTAILRAAIVAASRVIPVAVVLMPMPPVAVVARPESESPTSGRGGQSGEAQPAERQRCAGHDKNFASHFGLSLKSLEYEAHKPSSLP